jgi:hypothetical protein
VQEEEGTNNKKCDFCCQVPKFSVSCLLKNVGLYSRGLSFSLGQQGRQKKRLGLFVSRGAGWQFLGYFCFWVLFDGVGIGRRVFFTSRGTLLAFAQIFLWGPKKDSFCVVSFVCCPARLFFQGCFCNLAWTSVAGGGVKRSCTLQLNSLEG